LIITDKYFDHSSTTYIVENLDDEVMQSVLAEIARGLKPKGVLSLMSISKDGTDMTKKLIPKHWKSNTWEEKARENPLYAVMTMPEMESAGAEDFSPEHLQLFFEKGRKLANRLVMPSLKLAPTEGMVIEYGCGAGRILSALVARGIQCVGIDISPTMLEHCRNFVPDIEQLVCLDAQGRVELPDGYARVVYSYAVVQHIDKLSAYEKAVQEMCRLLRPQGRLVLQVNCEDYTLAQNGELGRTENYEDYSVHYAPGESKGKIHNNTTWSGVYIGLGYLQKLLASRGVSMTDIEPYNEKKPRAIVVFGIKG
jgi:ubiquinone/menaquinone biosynthesis C-methylase UbiE